MHLTRFGISPLLLIVCCMQSVCADPPDGPYDLVIYGGTSAGVIAGVQAARMGKSVVIVGPDRHLGGLSSGGLGWTDTGDKSVIGGLAREFYHRVWRHYQEPEAWVWQTRETYGNRGQGTPAIDGERRTMWIFEPHVAERVFEDLVREHGIPVHRDEWLDRDNGVVKQGTRIRSITMLSGKTYRGRMFIDATYEGDLMAAAGVDYHVGREGQDVYGEQWNGVQTGVLHHRHHFGVLPEGISPYVIPGDPSSGVLARISTEPPGEFGQGDDKVQAYCFRMCLTDHPDNRVPFPRPDNYDPTQYELLVRIFDAGWRETFHKFDPIPNRKTDTNNHGPMSTDNIGYNHDYPEASYAQRQEIIREHRDYQQGWLYFIANDPRVPDEVRDQMNRWGLARDEFVDNDHWPHQLYIREARRMIGQYIMTENELLRRRPTPDSIGMGSYGIDSHNVQRYITSEGFVQNEGDIGVATPGPYAIAYGSIVPRDGQCENLLVPVCVSSSHIAFGSIRMEPVFMILGQSAATAAVLALDSDWAVQDVPYETLRRRLLEDEQILDLSHAEGAAAGQDPAGLQGVVIDDSQAALTGLWIPSTALASWIGSSYRHDGNTRDGRATARFETRLPKAGRYEVRLSYTPHSNRASRVPVSIDHAHGSDTILIDQRQPPPVGSLFLSLGEFEFDPEQTAAVMISNIDTDGYVIIDAVQWLWIENSGGSARELFNGRDLTGFYTWLRDTQYEDPRGVFSVTNGMIRISGDGLGYLATREAYENYRLIVEFKWGSLNTHWNDRIGRARDSGIFLHATGPDGNSHDGDGAFMAAIECNLFQGATGDFLLIRGNAADGRLIAPRITARVAAQLDADGWWFWQADGKPQTIETWGRLNWFGKSRAWRDELDFRGPQDLEKPYGEWNTIECIAEGDQIVIRINGVVANEAYDVWPTRGQILLQCEGSELFVRRMELKPSS
jgi:hypothetical protein